METLPNAQLQAHSPPKTHGLSAFFLSASTRQRRREPEKRQQLQTKFNWNFDNKHNLILDLLLSAGRSWVLPRSNTLPGILFFDVWRSPHHEHSIQPSKCRMHWKTPYPQDSTPIPTLGAEKEISTDLVSLMDLSTVGAQYTTFSQCTVLALPDFFPSTY